MNELLGPASETPVPDPKSQTSHSRARTGSTPFLAFSAFGPLAAEREEPAAGARRVVDQDKSGRVADSQPSDNLPVGDSNPFLAPSDMSPLDLVRYLFDMQEKPRSIQKLPGFSDAVIDAADRLLAADTSDKFHFVAADAKWTTLHERACAGDTHADQQLGAFVEAMRADTRPKIAEGVAFFLLEQRAINADDLPLDKIDALLVQLEEFFAAQNELTSRHLRIASNTVRAINRLADGDQRESHFTKFGTIFARAKDRQLASYGKGLAKKPAALVQELIGKQIDIEGLTTLGIAFDWDAYRGKFVIIDFWATWCGPCVQAMPKLRALYDRYHDHDLEVVGISLDKDLEALALFLEEHEVPWENLSGESTQALATKYGVRGLPSLMLVDGKGRIVAVSHEVDELEAPLKKLLAAAA